MSCAVAPPGSPVFSPSRLLLPGAPDHHHHHHSSGATSALRFLTLRARIFADPCTCAKALPAPPAPPPPATTTPPPALKRRRPAPLLVPAAVTVAPPAPEAAGANGMMDEVAEHGEGFAAYCRKGKGRKRVEMEDRHVAAVALGAQGLLFGVFDGHGGKRAAEFAAEHMPRIMAEELRGRGGGGAEEAVRRAYLRTDEEFCSAASDDAEAGGGGGGACAVTALLREVDGEGRRRQLVVSGAGDCRAVLSRGGEAEALTDDHRASRRDERDRIEALRGGLVLNCRGVWRVQGSLAVTRGIGDAHLKPWVVPEPETATVDVDERCDLLVLASDGLWDKVGNQEAVDAARAGAASPGGLPAACRRLVEMAASRGSTDDISVVVVQLQRLLRQDRTVITV